MTVTELARPAAPATSATTWVLAPGVELLGEYQGGGWTEPRYLVRRGDGQHAQLTELIYRLLEVSTTPGTAADMHKRLAAAGALENAPASLDDVETMLRDQLAPVGMITTGITRRSSSRRLPKANPLLALGFRGTVLPARAVRAIARPFAIFFYSPVIALMAVALVVGDIYVLVRNEFLDGLAQIIAIPLLAVPITIITLALAILHEFGHAAGCHFGGGKPGRVGVGIYLIWPAFFTDVTDAYRLNRRARIRTDLGGLYFSFLGILLVIGAYVITGWEVLALILIGLHVQAFEQLMPFIRQDGYYLLGDISGVPDPFALVPSIIRRLRGKGLDPRIADLRPGALRLITVWTLLVIPFLLAGLAIALWMLPHAIPDWIASVQTYLSSFQAAVDAGETSTALYAGASLLFLLVPVVGGGILFVRMVRSLRRAIRRRHPRAPRRTPRHRR